MTSSAGLSPAAMSLRPLAGRAAVVSGSTSGIGRAIALELAAAGADVLVHGRANRAGGEDAVQEIRRLGVEAELAMCDLADEDGQQTLLRAAIAWRPDVSIWINNAGADVLTGDAARATFDEKLALLWQVDVLAAIRLSRGIGEHFQAHSTPGSIINIGWDQAETGMAGDSGEMFAAVKGAVMAFTRSLAQSLAPLVRVNCLAPGWIKTAWGVDASEYWQARAQSESLLERWGTAEDVARAACFLASPAADFITGQVMCVNGGAGRKG